MNTQLNQAADNPIRFQHYRELPGALFAESMPAPCPAPLLLELNLDLLDRLGMNSGWFSSRAGLSILSGNSINETNRPIAMAYSGHQFGQWSPVLGDGRAHMLGQVKVVDGRYIDLQLKGSGRTQFSRGGDGKATLGSVIREYLLSEAMAGLGIPTTRSIAMLTTGDRIAREQLNPGAILLRSAESHLRVGSFQYAYANLGKAGVKALADFCIAHHFPELTNAPEKYLELLTAIGERQASLIAQWMLVGFIHGVMNTDNMSIIGDTIDFGPCAFMDEYNPDKVFSSIDQQGRYAWDQQPMIGSWNLTRLAETLLVLFDNNEEKSIALAEQRLSKFIPQFQLAFQAGLMKKFGISKATEQSRQLTAETLVAMETNEIDFTVFFDSLTRVADGESDLVVLNLFKDADSGLALLKQWRTLISNDDATATSMRQVNPLVIARNHRVEQVIEAAVDENNFEPFKRLCRVLANPYHIGPADRELTTPPKLEQRVTQTFCGT